ncbi:BLUF domain-containing protein [Psychroflexus halocasei]|nr:BLUF domain-containing protein [Psychroflexus halocasei]
MSFQTQMMTQKDVEDFLLYIREKNSRLGITGILLLIQGKFIQYIEGPSTKIDKLYKTIEKDKRHKDMMLLDTGSINEQQFKDWSMAYHEVSEKQVKDIMKDKSLDLKKIFIPKEKDNHPALEVLYNFVNTLTK